MPPSARSMPMRTRWAMGLLLVFASLSACDPAATPPPGDTGATDAGTADTVTADAADLVPLDPCEALLPPLDPCQRPRPMAGGGCGYESLPDGSPCDDGRACSGSDRCAGGLCRGEPLTDCDDGVDCTLDACSEAAGGCFHTPSDPLCPPPEPCRAYRCDARLGCRTADLADGLPCDDGDGCTVDDACRAGGCIGTPVAACECGTDLQCRARWNAAGQCNGVAVCDASAPDPSLWRCVLQPAGATDCRALDPAACTFERCNLTTGGCEVQHAEDGAACDDGVPCTHEDRCLAGSCAGFAVAGCGCSTDADCAEWGGDPCTGAPVCRFWEASGVGQCVLDPGLAVVCPPAGPCTETHCEPTNGQCVTGPAFEGAACATGDACTPEGACRAGACVAANPAPLCDDGNPCTDDRCDPSSGACAFAPSPAPVSCDDGDLCTVGDQCLGTVCLGSLNDCDDHNPCTNDACAAADGRCNHAPRSNVACDDGRPETPFDRCVEGDCVGYELVPVGCTDDADCADASACTGDTCTAGRCEHTPLACGPPQDCVQALCAPDRGLCEPRALAERPTLLQPAFGAGDSAGLRMLPAGQWQVDAATAELRVVDASRAALLVLTERSPVAGLYRLSGRLRGSGPAGCPLGGLEVWPAGALNPAFTTCPGADDDEPFVVAFEAPADVPYRVALWWPGSTAGGSLALSALRLELWDTAACPSAFDAAVPDTAGACAVAVASDGAAAQALLWLECEADALPVLLLAPVGPAGTLGSPMRGGELPLFGTPNRFGTHALSVTFQAGGPVAATSSFFASDAETLVGVQSFFHRLAPLTGGFLSAPDAFGETSLARVLALPPQAPGVPPRTLLLHACGDISGRVRRYALDLTGRTVSGPSEFWPEATGQSATGPALALLADGTALAVWSGGPSGDAAAALWARRLDANGEPLDASAWAPVPPSGADSADREPTLCALPAGGFLLAWTHGPAADPAAERVWFGLFGPDGLPTVGPLPLDSSGSESQRRPAAACGADGALVAFVAEGAEGGSPETRVRLLDDTGQPLGTGFALAAAAVAEFGDPQAVFAGEGHYLVAYLGGEPPAPRLAWVGSGCPDGARRVNAHGVAEVCVGPGYAPAPTP